MVAKSRFDKLYRYAFAICNDRDLAFDILQTTLEKLLEKGKNLDDLNDSYIYSALKSRFIDHLRKDSKYDREVDSEQAVHSIAETQFNDIVCDRDTIEWMMNQLRLDEKELLYLHLVEGYKTKELSDILKTPLGTILSKLQRLKLKLRSSLDTEAQTGEPK